MNLRHAVRTAIASAALALAATSSHAETFRWDVTFDFLSGGQGVGVFYSDGTTFTDWNITTFRDPSRPIYEEVVWGYTYTSATSTLDLSDGIRLLRNDNPQELQNGWGNFLQLGLATGMAQGGTFSGGAMEHELTYGGYSRHHSGFVNMTSTPTEGLLSVATPVPEPEAVGMLVLGLAFVGAAARRKQRAG